MFDSFRFVSAGFVFGLFEVYLEFYVFAAGWRARCICDDNGDNYDAMTTRKGKLERTVNQTHSRKFMISKMLFIQFDVEIDESFRFRFNPDVDPVVFVLAYASHSDADDKVRAESAHADCRHIRAHCASVRIPRPIIIIIIGGYQSTDLSRNQTVRRGLKWLLRFVTDDWSADMRNTQEIGGRRIRSICDLRFATDKLINAYKLM